MQALPAVVPRGRNFALVGETVRAERGMMIGVDCVRPEEHRMNPKHSNSKQKPRRELFACPNCGADVPVGAAACKECGSDATTGWRDAGEIEYASVDLPDGYRDEARSEELPPRRTPLWIVIVALLLAIALVALVATGRW